MLKIKENIPEYAFLCIKIWWFGKKAVILHPISERYLNGVSDFDYKHC